MAIDRSKQHEKLTEQRGAAQLIFVIFFVLASSAIIFMITQVVYRDVARLVQTTESIRAYRAAVSANEDMAYRIATAAYPDAEEVITLNGVTATSTMTVGVLGDEYTVRSTAETARLQRSSEVVVLYDYGASFSAGVHVGEGGFVMENSSALHGSLFSNGSVVGAGSNYVYGDIIAASSTGLVEGVIATGTVRSYTIRDAQVEKDAFAHELDGGSVGGDAYYHTALNAPFIYGDDNGPGYTFTPEDPIPFPIDDTLIELWEDEAAAGGVIAASDPECSTGTYTIDSDTSLGPVKVECDVVVEKPGTTLSLTGPVWVEGDLDITQGTVTVDDPSEPKRTFQIIADVRGDRANRGLIDISASAEILGQGDESYVMLISMNTDAETNYPSHTKTGISGGQGSDNDLIAYAPHGSIRLRNNGSLNQMTAFVIELENSIEVFYEDGLSSPYFTSGPPTGAAVVSWREIE